MFSRYLEALAVLVLFATSPAEARELKVCLDPDNMPLSNRLGEGLENRIAEILADELGASLTYVWWNDAHKPPVVALKRKLCDLIPDMLADAKGVATTQPYLRSAYAFVTRGSAINSFDQAALRQMRIGVQSIGDDAASPPATELLKRGLGGQLQPFSLRRHYGQPNSARAMVAAVADGKLDSAVLWGPFAGYFASRHQPALTVSMITSSAAQDSPMAFDIAIAVRKDDPVLLSAVERALTKRHADIAALIEQFDIPHLPEPAGQSR